MQNYSQFIPYQWILTERQGQGFSEAEVTEVLYQVLLQLAQWHDQGQAYGLISLATIAYDRSSSQVVLLQGNQFVSGYIAPEVAESGQISAVGDMYALGVAIAVLLTGKSPEVIRNKDGSWNLRDYCTISDQFEQILNFALIENAVYRYANARQMLMALVPNLQVPMTSAFDSTNTTAMLNQQSNKSKSVPWRLASTMIVVVLLSVSGFAISRFLIAQNNIATNSSSPTFTPTSLPSPDISAPAAIATISTPTSFPIPIESSNGLPTITNSNSHNATVVSRERVNFDSGSTKALMRTSVSSSEKRQYILNCGRGQRFNANLLQGLANIRLIAPDGKTVSSGINNLSAILPASGDYILEISAFESTNFNLQIEVL